MWKKLNNNVLYVLFVVRTEFSFARIDICIPINIENMKTGYNAFKILHYSGVSGIYFVFVNRQRDWAEERKFLLLLDLHELFIVLLLCKVTYCLHFTIEEASCQFFTFCFLKLMSREMKMAKFLQNRRIKWMFMNWTILGKFSQIRQGKMHECMNSWTYLDFYAPNIQLKLPWWTNQL